MGQVVKITDYIERIYPNIWDEYSEDDLYMQDVIDDYASVLEKLPAPVCRAAINAGFDMIDKLCQDK